MAEKESPIHAIHPLAKLITTVIYLVAVLSFGKYEITGLLPYIFYPLLIFVYAEIPVTPILKRLLFIEPFIIGIGILNPIFDQYAVMVGGVAVSRGFLTLLSILIKSAMSVTAALLMIAVTGMDKLAAALRMLRVPRLIVLQLLLTYRYVTVLMEEADRMLRAYSLRAPGQKGVHYRVWGSFAGQLMLRTFERAQNVYAAMCLRGFDGEYHMGDHMKMKVRDFAYIAGWCAFFITARIYNISLLIGSLLTGVMK